MNTDRRYLLQQPFYPEDHENLPVDTDSESDYDTVGPYYRRRPVPVRLERSEIQDAIHTTAEFLVNNMVNFQGCPPEAHSHARDLIREQIIIEPPVGPSIVEISDLVDSFYKRIPTPEDLLPEGKWIDPSDPNIPTAEDFESLCCGTIGEYQHGYGMPEMRIPKMPVQLSLLKSERYTLLPENLSLSVAYDIDSILAFPTSLAVATSGLQTILHPSIIKNIRSDLHIRMNIPGIGRLARRTARLCDVPHFHLGKLSGPLNVDVFVFLPALYEKDRSTNFPTQDQLARFFDNIFLPSVYANASPGYLQHLPASYADAKAKSLASDSEKRSSARSFRSSRIQLLHYHLPTELLDDIWNGVLTRIELPGSQHFRDVRLFLNAKNMKMETKRPQPLSCFTDFLQRWSQSCDGRYLQPRDTWIDYGKEVVYPVSRLAAPDNSENRRSDLPHVHLWRKCCLQNLVRYAREKSQVDRGGFRATYYHWAQTAEAANMTLTPNKSNVFFRGGLFYSQFYSSTKEIFDAAKIYPFDNPSLEALAIDPHLTKAIQSVGGGQRIDLGKVGQAYLTSRDRTLRALRTNIGKSYGVREEHRVTMDLFKSIAIMLESPNMRAKAAASMTPRISNPFFCLPTDDVFDFLQYNCLRYIIPFEVIARSTISKDVPWESTKVMVMLLRCLRSAFTSGLLRDQSAIWKSVTTDRTTGDRRVGMGFEETLEQFGFGWLLLGRVDWVHLTFDPALSESILFNDNALLKSYSARWGRVRTVKGTFLEVDQLAPVLRRCAEAKALPAVDGILTHFDSLCIRIYRQDTWQALSEFMIFNNYEDEVRCLNGDVALTHRSIQSRRDPEKCFWWFPQPCNRWKFTPTDIVARTWYFDNGKDEVLWDKPFRRLFRHCHRTILRTVSKTDADIWKTDFLCKFLKYNRTFPHPDKHSFLKRATKRNNSPLGFHTAVHIELEAGVNAEDVQWWEPSVWTVGNAERYIRGDTPELRKYTVGDVIRKAERILARPRRDNRI